MITVSHLGVQYRTVEALRDASCVIRGGRLTGIIGPNGAGEKYPFKSDAGISSCHEWPSSLR